MSSYFEKVFLNITEDLGKIWVPYCLISMIEKCRDSVGNDKVFGVFLTKLSKAFVCHPHDLSLLNFNTYCFSLSSTKLIHSYLSNWKQRKKRNSAYSSLEEMLFGVPQGSILGSSLFNNFLCDLLSMWYSIDFANYT